MPNYHVKLDKNGRIIAGSVNKNGQWHSHSDVTDEVLAAARDHLLYVIQKEQKQISYAWNYDNGKTLLLKLEEESTENVKEGE